MITGTREPQEKPETATLEWGKSRGEWQNDLDDECGWFDGSNFKL